MKINSFFKLFTLVTLILQISCEEKYETGKGIPVLQGILISGQTPKIILAETLDAFPEYAFDIKYFDQPFVINNYKQNVEITVISGNNSFSNFKSQNIELVQNQQFPSGWESQDLQYFIDDNLIVEAGKDYEISVTPLPDEHHNWNFKYIKAKAHIPQVITLNIQQLTDKPSTNNQNEMMQVYQFNFDDPAEEKNYYYLSLLNVSYATDFSLDTISIDLIWKEYCSNVQKYSPTPLKLQRPWAQLYFNQINFTDKFQLLPGYFISDEDFNGETLEIRLEYEKPNDGSRTEYIIAELMHVSKEYYYYYSSIYQQQESQTDIYAEPVELFTNVENGLGVFAGASIDTKFVKIVPKPN